ncbi:aromatic-ring-hydroxylating dioxygenase subunit beta [Saccharopolyspora sp. TS4A08]|uniref:Aromatic-ring-hydroxylating dioxygenase subunit beta n=1 Tax=Saccharopolyspora ipomoeae TaxID=3042027 RepID=A0ABT6PGK6_9PSEU|nr:aromatic-ring-hydroxylating dioxygenase subunit beta [Saccharopolyspora sp. TS4A08]MDI2027125.1 aromatic-ring-hydroxylating dioxygenase subunit beta [Saccharopolyspora sp. TS4A08]
MTEVRNPVDARVTRAIALVWREAELLDRKDYAAWQELYADDGIYVVPIDRDAEEFDDVLNMVYDDRRMRRLRVNRMTEGYAIAAVDSAVTVRTVSRFTTTRVSDAEVSLRAAQVLVAYKRGTHDLWAADVDYTIRLGTEDTLARKVVRLVNSDDAVPAAGFLL